LGLIRSAQTSRPVNRDPTLGLRSVIPNQSANPASQSIKREAVLLIKLSEILTSLQHRANKTQSPPNSAHRSNSAPALYLSASATLICDFLRIATNPTPRNPILLKTCAIREGDRAIANEYAENRTMNFLEIFSPPLLANTVIPAAACCEREGAQYVERETGRRTNSTSRSNQLPAR
jgi:hypothetical protein